MWLVERAKREQLNPDLGREIKAFGFIGTSVIGLVMPWLHIHGCTALHGMTACILHTYRYSSRQTPLVIHRVQYSDHQSEHFLFSRLRT